MIRTGEQFLESLRDGRVVYVGGELIDDVTTHPKTRAQAARLAEFYDLHHKPELQDIMTFVDEDGERRSMMWYRHVNAEELTRKRHYLETVIKKLGAGSTPRTPAANNYCLLTYADDPQPWSDQSIGTDGRDLTVGIREFYQMVSDNDYNCALAFIDPQVDRSKDRTQVDSPALRIVSTNDEGIIVRGVKAVATGVPFADFLHMGVFVRPGMPGEEVIYGAIPVNAPGITVISRETTVKDDPVNHPLASQGDELDCTVLFEDVLIPWKYVFHIGNPQHAALYPQRVFDWVHYEALVRQMVRAELMVGLAMLMTATSVPTRSRRCKFDWPSWSNSTKRYALSSSLRKTKASCRHQACTSPMSCCSTWAGLLPRPRPHSGRRSDRSGRTRIAAVSQRGAVERPGAARLARAAAHRRDRQPARPAANLAGDPRSLPHRLGRSPDHLRAVQRFADPDDPHIDHEARGYVADRIDHRTGTRNLRHRLRGSGQHLRKAGRIRPAARLGNCPLTLQDKRFHPYRH